MEEVPVFRSAKRRKFTRAHQEPSSPEEQVPASPGANGGAGEPVSDEIENEDEDGVAISNLIRARKHVRKPVTGVHFSTARAAREAEEDNATSTVAKSDTAVDKPIDITNRFIGSTGQVVNVDRHMVAFVDAEMARRRANLLAVSDNSPQNREDEPGSGVRPSTDLDQSLTTKKSTTNPTSIRQLSEVDLGSLAHDTNLARTQAALERVQSGRPPVEEVAAPPKPRKPRLGRDGKPMKPRPRKRRNSEDIARDALVEQVLRENKIDLYDSDGLGAAVAKEAGKIAEENGEADERFAEQFRQQFFDAIAERHHRHKSSNQSNKKGAAPTESKGPKLGGSRSARAKMAQMLQQQQHGGQSSGKK